MIQLENELAHAPNNWDTVYHYGGGDEHRGPTGEAYTEHYRQLHIVAKNAGLNAPFYSMTGWGELTPPPENTYIPTYGGYMFLGEPGPANSILTLFGTGRFEYKGKYPLGFCELGPGSPARTDYRPAPSADSSYCTVFTRLGGSETTLLGYYMFHGGSNPRHPYYGWLPKQMNMPLISYDFYSPISEFGYTRESYRRLRPLNQFTQGFGAELSLAQCSLEQPIIEDPNDDRLRVVARANQGRGFIFAANYANALKLSDRKGVQFTIANGQDEFSFPQKVELNIPQDDFAILPFNLDLADGISLKYASAQPFSRIEDNGETWLFFHAVGGAETAEFCFAGDGFEPSKISGANDADGSIFTLPVGEENKLTLDTGTKKYHFVTLHRAQAENSINLTVAGEERLVLCEENVIAAQDGLTVLHENPESSVSVFPPIDSSIGVNFQSARVDAHAIAPKHQWDAINERRGILTLSSEAFEGANELFARIDYAGDLCRIFDAGTGELLADDLQLGEPWVISLRRFKQQLTGAGLHLRIEPKLTKNEGNDDQDTMLLDSKQVESGEDCRLRSIQLVPQYATKVAF